MKKAQKRKKKLDYVRKWQESKRAQGLCITCGKNPANKFKGSTRTRCVKCAEKQRVYTRAWKKKTQET